MIARELLDGCYGVPGCHKRIARWLLGCSGSRCGRDSEKTFTSIYVMCSLTFTSGI